MNTSEQQPPTRGTHQIVELLGDAQLMSQDLFYQVLGKARGHHLTRRALVPAKGK